MTPSAGIVIRTFNEENFIDATLSAVFRQDRVTPVVVVVDSESTDGTLRHVARYPSVEVVTIPRRSFTYGRALNLGISVVADRVPFVALLSAHALPTSALWLDALVAPLRSHQEVSGVYGRQLPWPTHLSHPVVSYLATFSYPACYGDQPFMTRDSYFFSNANSAIRIAAWRDIRFDEFAPYCEDWLWARSIIGRNHMIAYSPDAAVFHSHPETYRGYLRRRRREEAGYRYVDPEAFPPLTKRAVFEAFCYMLSSNTQARAERSVSLPQKRSYLCIRILGLIAAYLGRRDTIDAP